MVEIFESLDDNGYWDINVFKEVASKVQGEVEAKRKAVRMINSMIGALENDRKRLTDEILAAT